MNTFRKSPSNETLFPPYIIFSIKKSPDTIETISGDFLFKEHRGLTRGLLFR